jgi:hypothetical protein
VWATAAAVVASAGTHEPWRRRAPADVDRDLHAVGQWARTHLAPSCVDYLVGNEYTAYWLHLAVLRNERMAPRSADNDLYLTASAFARWIEGRATAPYAIARLSVLPAEIRERLRVLHLAGDAAAVASISSTPGAADGTCDALPLAGAP